ncbi:hypothetical protein H5410_015190 [Solanum commersonii]|uniref:Uncharacterized protein n=1 Tax=Solanum commersonii TaxID=4109 RepID=A0A9J5ZT10_SOLCO|nr:hypothetical protein H5410_015190 [Solanum commersonii]
MELFFVRGHVDTFVEIELAQVASIARMRIFGDVREALKEVDQKARKGAVGESSISSAKQYCTTQ